VRKLLLVWSAPNSGYQRKNSASVMHVDGDNEPEFVLFEADPKREDGRLETSTLWTELMSKIL
jgi:hypothetical protein